MKQKENLAQKNSMSSLDKNTINNLYLTVQNCTKLTYIKIRYIFFEE